MAAQAQSRSGPAAGSKLKSKTRSDEDKKLLIGRYGTIILSVVFFLIFDLGVLVLNFYTSFQISDDALGINLSGRQRMLSQRVAKSIFTVDSAQKENAPYLEDARKELAAAATLFDETLRAFQLGAEVPGGDGTPVFLNVASGAKSKGILEEAQIIWQPYLKLLAPVINATASQTQTDAAVEYARKNNVRLLGLMNDLTTDLEVLAESRALRLRMVQTIGIMLALLNFLFIMYKFVHQVQTSDRAIAKANEENAEILSSVREGLFLITPDYRVGSQVSASSSGLFGRKISSGDDFFELLAPIVSSKVLADGREYVGLLFSPHVKESLVQSINPLSEVDVQVKNKLGGVETRCLSFFFNRSLDGSGGVRHLLITVQDVTERIELESKLQKETHRAQREFMMLIKAIDSDPVMLRQFVDRADASLLAVNDLLRHTADSSDEREVVRIINDASRRIHAFKGDAAAVNLDSLSEMAHAFENELLQAREAINEGTGAGDVLLALPVSLESLLVKVSALKNLISGVHLRADALPAAENHADDSSPLARALQDLGKKVAADTGKNVVMNFQFDHLAALDPAKIDLLREISVQLVRNAIVHGIETPETREAARKPAAGAVHVRLVKEGDSWVLRVRDDGAGLSLKKIREKLVELGWYTPESLRGMSPLEIINNIFKPCFSTEPEAGMHAGRGVGLDLVMENVRKLKSRQLHVSSQPGRYTEFVLKFT